MPGNDRGGVPPGAGDAVSDTDETLVEFIDRRYRELTNEFWAEECARFERNVIGVVNGPGIRAERPARVQRAIAHAHPGVEDLRTWYRFTNKASDTEAEVYIYDEIGYFGVTAQSFVDDLNEFAANAKRITVRINSPGGDVFDGIAIGNALRNHPANIVVRVDALAASAASFITAMSGGEVIMGAFAQMMIHDASGLAIGNAKDMRDMADLLDRLSDTIASTYAAKAGGSRASWRDLMRDETWFDGPEAVAAGLADQSLSPEDDEAGESAKAVAAKFDVSNFAYPGREQAPPPKLEAVAQEVEPEAEVAVPTFSAAEFRALMELASPTAVPDADIIRAGIKLVANDQPAPTRTKEPEQEATGPAGFGPIDAPTFYNAIREALIR